jgi:methionyl-tRNA formyltransferase
MSDKPLRVVFAGTPEFAAIHLAKLLHSQHEVIAVYTQPDRPSGRGKKLQASPVKQLAQEAGIAVYQPVSLKTDEAQQQLADLHADVMVVVAYGLILPQAILDTPRLGCLNVHASLLPRWRGAAPIQRAIEAGDEQTGTTIMQMDAGLDTGDMLATASCTITPHTTAALLHDELAAAGAPLLLQVLDDLPHYQGNAVAQDGTATNYADKILKSEALINWQLDATTLNRQVRAFNPFPVCYSLLQGERVKIWDCTRLPGNDSNAAAGTVVESDRRGIIVQCGTDQLCITKLQLPGAKALTAEQVLNARSEQFAVGVQFDTADT